MVNNQKQPETQPEAEPVKNPEQQENPPKENHREAEIIAQLQRLQAEFDNYRKRVDAESEKATERGEEKIVKQLLPVIDSFELAIKHTHGDSEAVKEHRQGLELIYSQFLSILESIGVERIKTDGVVDPRLHEVYITETTDTVEPNTILETLQQGYTRKGAVLRTAKVKAARR